MEMSTGSSDTEADRYQLESPKSPDRHFIPRRFPRIGSQFQTRIAKSTSPLDRPLPERMSTIYPHITENETKNADNLQDFAGQVGKIVKLTYENTLPFDASSRRGGTLLHAPSRDMNQYSAFVHPFVTSLSSLPRPQISPPAWVQHMIHLHSNEIPGKRKRVQRGAVKRKRPHDEELVWSLEDILESQKVSNGKRRKKLAMNTFGEEEGAAMDYVGQHFHGNFAAATFNVVAALSGGRASKMKKIRGGKWKERRSKAPSTPASISWRNLYERVALPSKRSLRQQLQQKSLTHYTHDGWQESRKQIVSVDRNSDISISWEFEDLRGAWRSMLACGKSIERQLNGELSGDKKPLLSTLLAFVANAYSLLPPEACFGTHHVVIEELSKTMVFILGHVQKAQQVQARLRDKMFNETGEGTDSEALLTFLETDCEVLPVRLPEAEQLRKDRDVVVEWETRLSSLFELHDDGEAESVLHVSLANAESLRDEAKSHGYVSKALAQLISRIQKASDLRSRIMKLKNSFDDGRLGSLKNLSSLIKEVYRIKLDFPEASDVVEYHHLCESWIDRANVAIRSKMALREIKSLIQSANKIPLDLSEYREKLKTRVRAAEQWLDALDEVVPFKCYGEKKLEWMRDIDNALHDSDPVRLHELSSEGNRMPVVVDEAVILQVAFDAKAWSAKAKKWIPNTLDSKKGKLTDLQDHLEKLTELRNRLPLSDSGRDAWSPDGEKELQKIVTAAILWFEKYHQYETSHGSSQILSMQTIKEIVEESKNIFAILGPESSRMSKILAQTETWWTCHELLLRRCRVIPGYVMVEETPYSFVELSDLQMAVKDAEAMIAIDIEEELKLKKILDKTTRWRHKISMVAPKRSKRGGRASRSKLTLSDLTSLIAESGELPIDTNDDVHRLQVQLSTIEAWRSRVVGNFESIIEGFHQLQTRVLSVFGEAERFSFEYYTQRMSGDDQSSSDQDEDAQTSDNESHLSTDDRIFPKASEKGVDVIRQIKDLQDGARDICVSTAEGELGEVLEAVGTWCVRSFKYLNSPREVFDNRHFGTFDRFLNEGKEILQLSATSELSVSVDVIQKRLRLAWGAVISGQLQRLQTLKMERETFKRWCRIANSLLSDEDSLSAEKLHGLAEQGRHFPTTTDVVSKVRGLSAKVNKWTSKVGEVLRVGRKMSVNDAQDLLESGLKLKVGSVELTVLQEKLDTAQNWLNKVCEYTGGENAVDLDVVHKLIEEHESLIVELPEEIHELRQAVVGYCLCRRPYEGFMIGCDHCDEWYHGSCIGVSESRAEKFEKFSCVRCSMKFACESSAAAAVGLIRKWTCAKDLKKARQVDYQKIQRKFRKEKKEIDKLTTGIRESEGQLFAALVDEDGGSFETSEHDGIEDETPSTKLTKSTSLSGDCYKRLSVGEPDIPKPQVNPGTMTLSQEGNIDACGGNTGTAYVHGNEIPRARDSNGQTGDALHQIPVESVNEKKKKGLLHTDGVTASNSSVELREIIAKAKISVEQAQQRLDIISVQSRHRKSMESKEDSMAMVLRAWMLHVRSTIVVPTDTAKAEAARPPFGVLLSEPMKEALDYAEHLGISDLPDVLSMENHFKCISWTLTALAFLRRKPSVGEINYIVTTADGLKLPDEKALRTLKFMTSRAKQLQVRSQKALAPKSGEVKSIDVALLNEIHKAALELPLQIPETKLLEAAIEDKGARHCLCGGPNDGLEMLRCDRCKGWFHSSCVAASAAMHASWFCPSCGGTRAVPMVSNKTRQPFIPTVPPKIDSTSSPHANDPQQLWPLFGLFGSKRATEALGIECSAISESTDAAGGATRPGKERDYPAMLPQNSSSSVDISNNDEENDASSTRSQPIPITQSDIAFPNSNSNAKPAATSLVPNQCGSSNKDAESDQTQSTGATPTTLKKSDNGREP